MDGDHVTLTTDDAAPAAPDCGHADQPGELDPDQPGPATDQIEAVSDAWDEMFPGFGDDTTDEQRWADLDVRAVVAQLPRDNGPRLDDVEWGRFRHAYGPAADLPVLLTRLSDPDPAAASHTLGVVWNHLRHQGGTSMAAPLAVPFLIRTATDPDVHRRGDLLDLAAEIGRRNHFGRDTRTGLLQAADDEQRYDTHGYPGHWSIQAGRDALAADAAILLALLDDPDTQVRCHAAYALAAASSRAAEITDRLRARLAAETEPAARISLLLAAAQLAREHHHQLDATTAWVRGLWSDPARPLDVRFGAGLARLCLTDTPPPAELLDLLAHAVSPHTADWMRQVPWPDDIDRHGGLGVWLAHLLRGDQPGPDTALTSRLSTSPHPQARIAAIRAGYHIAAQSRQATDEIVADMAQRLGDVNRPVALVAARYLGRVGAATAPVADLLAAAALDHDHDEVRAWATVGLAHAGDPRAVAPLAGLLGQDRCPWPHSNAAGADLCTPVRLLDALRPHAAELLPALIDRLHEGGDGWGPLAGDLVHGVGSWGEAAGPAARAVATFLVRGPLDTATVVTALGRIGPTAADLIPVLDPPPHSADDADRAVIAWACWRISGERTASTVATLTRAASVRCDARALRMLADLGPAADSSADTIRTMLANADATLRVEAAHTLWGITGQHAEALPVLLDTLQHIDEPDRPGPLQVTALEYLGEIGALAPEAIPVLQTVLQTDRRVGGTGEHDSGHDEFTWDQHVQHVAAHTLTRIQHATTE